MCQNVSKCVRMCQNVTNYVLEWMGLDFYYYLQPKMSVGIINEHECKSMFFYLLLLRHVYIFGQGFL